MQIKATRGHFSPSDRQNTKIADVPGIATGSWQGGGGGEGSPLADHGGGGGGFYKLNIHTYSIASSLKSF